jgi:hypothetical protein
MDDRTMRIRERAYQLWEREGRAPGQEHDHWRRAEAEIDGTSPSGTTSSDAQADGARDRAASVPSSRIHRPVPRKSRETV